MPTPNKLSFFLGNSLVGWLASLSPPRELIAVGIAWPNHLAVIFAMCISCLVVCDHTTRLFLLLMGGTGTDTGCAGCTLVEISVQRDESTHNQEPPPSGHGSDARGSTVL